MAVVTSRGEAGFRCTVKNSTVRKWANEYTWRLKKTLRKAWVVFTVSYSTVFSNRSDRNQYGTCSICSHHDSSISVAFCMGAPDYVRSFTWYTQMHLVQQVHVELMLSVVLRKQSWLLCQCAGIVMALRLLWHNFAWLVYVYMWNGVHVCFMRGR